MRNNLRLSLLAPVLLAVVGGRARAEPAPLGVTHVGLHTGVVLPQLGSELGTAPGVELEGGYRALPRLTLSLSVSYAQPTVAHAGDDPRLAAGSFDSETVQRELTVGAVAAWWFLPPSARLSGFAGVGYRQFFLASVTDGSSGGMPFLEHRETSSQAGAAIVAGGQYRVGPGGVVAAIEVGGSLLPHLVTGDVTTTALRLTLGYRLYL